ncbi:sugar phosphate isomerase/epimerase family protein [Pleomorphochaeta sp. DL1XJH-081]|uniref:sugar phosphate isomerase/epimerase family protein n=1 Tax=Pleomorphochaeta sp. DL1XJH-081 TaxID=3409690 RepID=UPI003BB4E68C
MKFGVSPAYFLSKYGEHFSPQQCIAEVPLIKKMGFDSMQLEITYVQHLDDWRSSQVSQLQATCEEYTVDISQLVAHFWIENSTTPIGILNGYSREEVSKLLVLAESLPGCSLLTVPFGKFHTEQQVMTHESYRKIERTLLDNLQRLCDMAQAHGVKIALELQPGSIIPGLGGVQQILSILQSVDNLGYNFDTGHAHAFRDVLETIPARLGNRIFGTHLCDNDGMVNLSLTPGEGTIDWEQVLDALLLNGYQESLDLEIMCPPEEVSKKYKEGLDYISQYVEK